jgi:hypothetical protein
MGGEPSHAHRKLSPQVNASDRPGANAPALAVSRSLLIGSSRHLRFSCEPIVEVLLVWRGGRCTDVAAVYGEQNLSTSHSAPHPHTSNQFTLMNKKKLNSFL